MVHDLPRYIKRYGLAFKMNPFFPINTLQAMRGCYAAMELGVFEQYIETVFDAMWVKGINLGDESSFKATLAENGIDADRLFTLISETSIKEQLKEATEKAVNKGCFGAPTMFVGKEMFFGQDRLEFVAEALSE